MSQTSTAARAGQPAARPAARPAREPAAQAAAAPTPLRRNLRFQTLWIGTAASTLGVSVADVAYPLAILAITGSPALAGLFAAVQVIGMLVAGLPTGSLADRHDCRAIMAAAEAGRATVTVAVVVALITGWLSLPVLLVAAALLGIGQAVKSTAALLLVRSVVPPEQLTGALTQDEVRISGAALAGPAIGGALYGISALRHASPFLFTAATFLIALACVAAMKFLPGGPPRSQPAAAAAEAEPPTAAAGGMLTGLRTLWEQPVLRAATLLIMFVNTIGAGLELVIIVILRHQSVPPTVIGLALGIGAAGGLAGAPLVKILHRLRPGVLLLAVCLLDVAVLALLAVPAGPWWVAGLTFTVMLGVPAIRVLVDILVIRQAPPEQRGRVVAAFMTLIGLGAPAGLAGCGLLLQYLPAQAAMLVLAGTEAAGVAYCSTRRELWQARWPAPAAQLRLRPSSEVGKAGMSEARTGGSTDFAERMLRVMNEAALALMVSVGHRTGLFDVMAAMPAATSTEIAARARLDERYVREWLAVMTTGRIVDHDGATGSYSLPADHAAWLTRAAGMKNLATGMQYIALMAAVEDQIVDCFRHGGGVPYSEFPRFQAVMAEDSGAVHDATLIEVTLPLVPGLIDRLGQGIDVADVGCGSGHAVNLMAAAFPRSRFTGFDFSDAGIAAARHEAERNGLANARFAKRDAARLGETGRFDFITTFDAVHDQARPDLMLAGIAGALRPGGVYLCVDTSASSNLAENLDHPLAPFLYTVSCMHCMTVSLADGGMGLGTMWGEQTARQMLGEAGFTSIKATRLDGDIVNAYIIATKD